MRTNELAADTSYRPGSRFAATPDASATDPLEHPEQQQPWHLYRLIINRPFPELDRVETPMPSDLMNCRTASFDIGHG